MSHHGDKSHAEPSSGSSPPYISHLRSFTSSESIAEASIAHDLQEDPDYDPRDVVSKHPRKHSYSSMSSRAQGGKRPSNPSTGLRRKQSGDEEAALSSMSDAPTATETTALLRDLTLCHGANAATITTHVAKGWQDAAASREIQTTWQHEAKVLARSSRSLVLTFMLQYSLPVASIFSVGQIGKIELGAVSLAAMTANITGYAIYQGLATSLDTLCAQAYGSGNKELVGLQMQRMIYFLWGMTVPIGMVWLAGTQILEVIVPDRETAALAGLFLKITLVGLPGYAVFESGKRFLQAQGLFSATLYVLLFCAPVNAFLNWLFVWHFGWGFIGAPIAVASTTNLLPICLYLYVRFVDGMQCWGGFSKKAFTNWGPMIRLSLPGLIMVLAEYLAFEILTLAASWISPTHLAAQSVLSTLSVLVCQASFAMSVTASTRIANLIGATLSDAAKLGSKVSFIGSCCVGTLNLIVLCSLRNHLPWLLTNDPEVADLVSKVLPICAVCELFDALAANRNGVLRGLGKQAIGGWIGLLSYYAIGIPISLGTGFGLHWHLYGFWAGSTIALSWIVAVEGYYIHQTSWEKAVESATKRNNMG